MTTELRQLLPFVTTTSVEKVIAHAAKASKLPFGVGTPQSIDLCVKLSQRLLASDEARPFPECASLGFWLRNASVKLMLERYLPSLHQGQVASAGIVFQIPPGNVPTFFVYNLAISVLCGNVTVVRLSAKETQLQSLLIKLLTSVLDDAMPSLRERIILLNYGHDEMITSALSQCCDVRMVWGGDATIAKITTYPLHPLARDIAFGDRFSSCALGADAYNDADEETRLKLIENFYNDIYWFDQYACASPRLLVWIGSKSACLTASTDFYRHLARLADQRYRPDAGASVAKLTMTYLALHDLPVISCTQYSQGLTVCDLSSLDLLSSFKRNTYGYGLLLTGRFEALAQLASYAERRDQTLTIWGLSEDVTLGFISACSGRGYDRIVPVGQALAFDPLWDGYNLFSVLTRTIHWAAK